MYAPLLLIHSWMRWLVLLSLVYFLCVNFLGLIKKRKWSSADSHFIWAFSQVFLYQILFGITLWLAGSPVVHSVLINPKTLLNSPISVYWSLIHPLAMISALGVFHIGKARAKKRAASSSKFKIYAVVFSLVLLIIACAIPWPFLTYGRPFFRMF